MESVYGIALVTQRIAEIQASLVPRSTAPLGDEAASGFQVELDRALHAFRPTLPVSPADGGIVTRGGLKEFLRLHDVAARNGRLEGSGLLVEVGGGWQDRPGRLLAPAAHAWEQMRAAAAADGVQLQAVDFYRSWEVQSRAYQAYLSGEKAAHVLPPGTSEHGNGLAIDLTNGSLIGPGDPEWHWMQANGPRFGWYPISNESWHWEFRGVG